MTGVVVLGGGYAGLASAARLAKIGHSVTLLEASGELGGALVPVREEGFTWDASATSTLLPAVMRDLFRKSGRPAERELELVPLDVVREHRFADKTSVAVPGGTRGAQVAAFDKLGAGLGEQWADYVARFGEDWEVLRQHYFEVPWEPAALPSAVAARLRSRETLHKRLRKTFKDERLRLVAGHPFVAAGQQLRDVPAWAGLTAYLEQRFGSWRVDGGMGVVAEVLADRMATRRVTVRTATRVEDIVVRGGRAVAVRTTADEIDLGPDGAVVVAFDPRSLPALRPLVDRTLPAIPPLTFHLGLGSLPDHLTDLPDELVLHGEPTLVVRTRGQAPEGRHAWTVHSYGKLMEDVLLALARHKIDLREHVVHRVDLGAAELVRRWRGSPLGVKWAGRDTVFQRLGPRTPIENVYAAGAHATPGSGLPFTGLSAALVAQSIGPA
ncbi:MAG: phytoene desaturase family protein [Nocardioides sp.]|uniref:phytoene desaturase family protein n=1 Tax=Nocardioides sp. TaxID=35761 RepID=UPI003D6C1C79